MANQFTFYGFPDECLKFEQRHPVWNEIMANLVKAMDLAFISFSKTNWSAA